jgi:hypothetical protein
MRSLSTNLRTIPLSFGTDEEVDSGFVNRGTVDTQGFSAVRFVVMVANSTGALRIRLKGADQVSSFSAVSSSIGQLGNVVEVNSINNKIVVLEVVRPRQRFLRLEARRVASASIAAILADMGSASDAPVPADESVADRQILVEPLP